MKRSLRSWLWRVSVRLEVDDEIAFHIEMRTRELVERGMDSKLAREIVLARIGDLGHLKRTCEDLGRKRDRDMRLTQWLEDLRDDVAVALRQLRASRAFTLIAVLTLALGIGANSAMFAVADAALLRPLPFPDADRLVAVSEIRRDGTSGGQVNPLDLVDWIERNRTFESMAGILAGQRAIAGADGTALPVSSQAVTTRFFDVLGVKPIAGRTFVDADNDEPEVVVLGEAIWRSHFGGDPEVIGREVRLSGRTFTAIGVVPAWFQFDIPGFPS